MNLIMVAVYYSIHQKSFLRPFFDYFCKKIILKQVVALDFLLVLGSKKEVNLHHVVLTYVIQGLFSYV